MEPIDNANKKTFIQWILGKGAPYTVVEIFIYLFYIISQITGIVQVHSGAMELTSFWVLTGILNLMFWVNLFKTYQNYQDDKAGRTR
jgi:hypothetical protein